MQYFGVWHARFKLSRVSEKVEKIALIQQEAEAEVTKSGEDTTTVDPTVSVEAELLSLDTSEGGIPLCHEYRNNPFIYKLVHIGFYMS